MVSESGAKTGPSSTNGVVGSFYDFFAQLYSSSFIANPPWATLQGSRADTEATEPARVHARAAPWAEGLEYPSPAVNGRRQDDKDRNLEADVARDRTEKSERCRKQHRLEFGWPEDDAGNLRTPMKAPKVSSGRTPRATEPHQLLQRPEGFPDPVDSPRECSRGQQMREQKQRELKEQREQVAKQQEEWLRRQQRELQEQREHYFQEQEAKFEERLPKDRPEQRNERHGRQERGRSDRKENYKADPEDLIDQHVAYFLRKNPEVRSRHKIERVRPYTYLLDNREVQIEWQYATEPGGQGFLVVVDGPLRQPFSDYMMDTEENATYELQDSVQSNLHLIDRESRFSFNDNFKVYNRLEAMKVAKEQAVFREKAATYVKDGQDLPRDFLDRYKKTIQVKLGHNRPKGVRPSTEEAPPSPEPPATQPPSPQPQKAPPPPPPAPYGAPAPPAPPSPAATPQPQTPARVAASPAPVGRMHSGQAAQQQPIGYGSYCPSPKPTARPISDTVSGGSTPGLPVPSPLPLRQQYTSSNPVLLGAGTPTSMASQPYKTQLPGTSTGWQRMHHTPRTPSGGMVDRGMDLPQLDPMKKPTVGLGLNRNPFEEPSIFGDRYAPSVYNRDMKFFPQKAEPSPGRPRVHYDY